jgi:4-amino-4-deoxychorismate lyase
MLTLVNGHVADGLPVRDRGLQYGDGLFETIAMQDGAPQFWSRHMRRLAEGCRRLELPVPEADQLRDEVARASAPATRAVAKIILTRGSGARGYRPTAGAMPTRVVQGLPWPEYPEHAAHQGVVIRWCATRLARQPRLAGIKHLNRLEQVLARAEWREEYAEGLMCDTEGLVIEGTMSNLFVVHQDTLITPDLSESGVAGVMRGAVLDAAARLEIPQVVQPLKPVMVEQAEALFLTNSLIGLWPVARLEARHYEVAGKITQALKAALLDAPDRLA